MNLADPVAIAQALLTCPSVTPDTGNTQTLLAEMLSKLGFSIEVLQFGAVRNLIARLGHGQPHFAFAGHSDVVPPGSGWRHDAFDGVIEHSLLFGRGAVDMKGAIAAFVAAVADFTRTGSPTGTISILITGDEEGPATDGTQRIVDHLARTATIPDFCLVGEPTCRITLGDTIKIGRRGSMSAKITIMGKQGHVAYPHLADNPIHRLLPALEALRTHVLDQGNEWFEPSSLQITSVDVGNPTGNLIPAQASATLNIRFNNQHTGHALHTLICEIVQEFAPQAQFEVKISGEPFLTQKGIFTNAICTAVETVTGITPKLDTGGGTSDARFITNYCPVAEFGLVGRSMHQIDEAVSIADLRSLTSIYHALLTSILV